MKGTTNVSEPRLPRPSSPADGGGLTIAGLLVAGALVLSPATVSDAATVPHSLQDFQHCVAQRESHGNPKARARSAGKDSTASGRYQFLDSKWRHGLSYMVAERLRAYGLGAVEALHVRKYLQSVSIDRWPAGLQDVAFAAVVSKPGGTRHWWIAGSKCNRLGGMR